MVRQGARSHLHWNMLIQEVLWRLECVLIFKFKGVELVERHSRSFKRTVPETRVHWEVWEAVRGSVIGMGSL